MAGDRPLAQLAVRYTFGMGLYRRAVLPCMHLLDPESSHALTLTLAHRISQVPGALPLARALARAPDPALAFTWRGLTFRSPIGLAAGADKNAVAPRLFHALGAGFIEIGTVTLLPQPGNPRPRVHRLTRQHALVNRLGFPSHGAARVALRLSHLRLAQTPIGVNIGKNAATPLAHAARDYAACLEVLYPHGDYFTVNVSSPNTEGLTTLQSRSQLAALLARIARARAILAGPAHPKPILVKISPDLSLSDLDSVLDVVLEHGLDGIIATNTSVDSALRDAVSQKLAGGLSGPMLLPKSLAAVWRLRQRAPRDFFIVGVGGISSDDDAWAMLQAGANAVQLYTALVYHGPGLFASLNRALAERVRLAGMPQPI
ncbi:MAG: quinone-dependent dihydroorotate dehydrogenase [Dehalococcoidia bacterium]|nr:quinone-dependent dihydroorotate dehydrogenase [Dehalococcoidia bacterium]